MPPLQDPDLKKILVACPNSPLSYPTQGLQVTLSAKLGVLDTVAEVEEVTLEGLGESRLSLSSPHLENLNLQLRTGWFAGRNLAISQVMTKYLLRVDDDFLFSEKTKLERMVEVLEKNSLDVVSGVLSQNAFQHVFKVVPGDSDGDCLYRKMSTYRRLDGFATCSLVDMVVNFFLARTEDMRSVSFDPQFSRIGHPGTYTLFFIDGLGKLIVGTCRDISIDHAPKKGNMVQYNRYHHAKEARSCMMRALFFKNYLVYYRT
ncbi:beta-1,4 N-acetylgalactosaminyltransferase 1-like [Lampetra fluviatilis]